jgi:hypothetical protein
MNIAKFNHRLSETVSWCLPQEIIDAPVEDENVTNRRSLNRQGAELFQKGYMMAAPYEHAGWFLRWRAKGEIRRAAEMRAQGQELMKTAAVTSIVPPLCRQLRSEVLGPFALSLAESGADHAAIVEQVAEARSQILRDSGRHSESQSSEPRGGRLLLYAPQDNLACGAAECLSLGFFDVDNVPPWDTWILVLGKYLVSWVPPQLVRLVQEGLDVNPEQCILWANDPSRSRERIGEVLGELSAKVA